MDVGWMYSNVLVVLVDLPGGSALDGHLCRLSHSF